MFLLQNLITYTIEIRVVEDGIKGTFVLLPYCIEIRVVENILLHTVQGTLRVLPTLDRD